MMLNNITIPQLPIGDYFENFIRFLQRHFDFFFEGVNVVIRMAVHNIDRLLMLLPGLIVILIFALLAWWASSKWLGLFTFIGLLVVYSMGFWSSAVSTLSLVLVSSIIALMIGIPLGILAAKSDRIGSVIRPLLDFMQTMPAFVYLIPAIILFERGAVAGTIATVIFAMPPVVRLTNLGIRQVPTDVIEAAKSLGSTGKQLLLKVQLPISLPTIFAGINQTIMLSLSMVVIASMIGAGGLGQDVRSALSRVDIGFGFEAGLAVVILAMIIDRITQSFGEKAEN